MDERLSPKTPEMLKKIIALANVAISRADVILAEEKISVFEHDIETWMTDIEADEAAAELRVAGFLN